jgi:hypothetical protein
MKIYSKRFLPAAGMSAPTSEGAYRLTFGGKGRGEQCLCLSSSVSHLSKNRCHKVIATVPNKTVFYDRGIVHPLTKLLCPLLLPPTVFGPDDRAPQFRTGTSLPSSNFRHYKY